MIKNDDDDDDHDDNNNDDDDVILHDLYFCVFQMLQKNRTWLHIVVQTRCVVLFESNKWFVLDMGQHEANNMII